MKKAKAFTLLEILLVVAAIAVLAGIVIVAINPARQLAATRNTARRSDVSAILNSIYQYSLDNNGQFPNNIDTNLKMIGTAASGCNVSCGGASSSSSSGNTLTITDNSQSTFAGIYANTIYNTNTSLINLSSSQTSGTYTSDIKDTTASATWSSLAWTPNRPTNKALPNNSATESGYPAGNINMNGNVLLLHLNEALGATTFSDSSGSGNNATCSGNACPTMGQIGKFGTAGNFNNTYLNVADSNSLDVGQGTWSAWIYPTSFSDHTYHTVIAKAHATAYWFGLYNNTGRIQLWVGGAANIGTGAVNLNQWSLISATWDGATVKYYINGVLDGSSSQTGQPRINNAVAHIGTDFSGGESGVLAYNFTGTIDEASVFNRSLSATEISDIYKRGVLSLKFQTRSCAQANCSDGTFFGPDGTTNTYYSEASNTSNATPSLSLTNISNNRYFQYKAFLDTTDSALTPELKSAVISGSTSGSGGGSSSTTAAACLDLSSALAPTYITSLPFDPKTGSNSQTYYAAKKTAGGRINVQACSVENGEAISLTK